MDKKKRQSGFIVSIELILIATILVIGLIVGMVELRDSVVFELEDVAEAIGNVDQTFNFMGVTDPVGGQLNFTAGSSFTDAPDSGDTVILDVTQAPANLDNAG